MKVEFKNKFNNILIFILSLNAVSVLLYVFSKYVTSSFNDLFFKKLGYSIFSIILILLFLFIIFLTKITKIKLKEITKKIVLITANIFLILIAFKMQACAYQKGFQEFQGETHSYMSQRKEKEENPASFPSDKKVSLTELLDFYKQSYYIIKKKILNKETFFNKKDIPPLGGQGAGDKKNILLITIDAVSPFHLDLHGYKRKTAPNITKFAKNSLQFNKAFSQGPNTRPAIASLMTSKYATEIYWSNRKHFIPLKQKNLTFAEILKKEGYETYGVVTHSYFLKRFGYNQGFDHWDMDLISLDGKIAFEQETAHRIYDKFKKITENANKKKPSFVWLHFFDPHDSYVKRKEATDWGDKIVDIYDNEIHYTDIYIGKLFEYLKEKKLFDDYIIILTSDHGEAFGSHGYMKHGRSVYNDQMWIPLIMKFPGLKHQVIEHEVSHIDIIPTLLDYLKIDKYKNFSGSSILKKIKDNDFPPIYTLLFKKRKNQYSISYKGYKLNYSQKQDVKKLFDIRTDMNEKIDISNQHPEILYDLWRRLSKWIKIQNKIYKERN